MTGRASRGGGRWRAALATAGALVTVAVSGRASGEVRESAERLAEAWRAVGAAVVLDKPRFLDDDETLVIDLPPLPDAACTSVALIGARGLGFHVSPAETRDDPNAQLASEAGALAIERCREPFGRRLLVTSDSGRGALEVVVARSESPLPGLRAVLPERSGSGLGPMPDPGVLPPLPSAERRAELAEARARRDGALVLGRAVWKAGIDGNGSGEAVLEPGCHVLHLFATEPSRPRGTKRARLDLDAEARDMSDDRLLSRDRSDAPDAVLPLCVGAVTRVAVAYVGATPGAAVVVAHVASPLPDHLPTLWGNEARARMAEVLDARGLASLPSPASALAQGGAGMTSLPVSIEPGACYVAIVALVEGSARSIGLRSHVGARETSDERGVDDAGSAVAFCAGDEAVATLEVEARGTPLLGWGLALYRLSGQDWESSR